MTPMTSPSPSPPPSSSSASSSVLFPVRDGTSAVAWSAWWELPPSLPESAVDQAGYYPSSTTINGAVRLLCRCQAEYGWDFASAKRILMAYKDFLYALSFLPSDHWLIPCPLVRDIWQLHICDTQRYATDCQLLLGRIVHYNNYLHDDDHMIKDEDRDDDQDVLNESVQETNNKQRRKHKRQMIQKTIKFICEKTNQEQLDPQVWQYYIGKGSVMGHLMSQAVTSEPVLLTKPLSLKRDSSSASNDNGQSDDCTNSSRKKKKMRLNHHHHHDTPSKAHPLISTTTTNQTKPSKVSLQIQFTSNMKNRHLTKEQAEGIDLGKRKNTVVNDENAVNHTCANLDKDNCSASSSFETFTTYKHAPLHRVFEQVAQAQKLDRQSLQFTYRGQVLEGTETPYALSKYYGIKKKLSDTGGTGASSKQPLQRMSLKPASSTTGGAFGGEMVLKIECSPLLSEC